jgi:hypothetical protein
MASEETPMETPLIETPNQVIRSPGQVRQQLKQVLFRHLQRELRENFRGIPESCYHNHFTSIGGSPERIGICRFEGPLRDGCPTPRGKVCDTRVAGCTLQARGCKYLSAIRTKEEVKSDFRALLTSDRGSIAARYPDVAALMWVLDGEDFTEELMMAESEADPPDPTNHIEVFP